MPGRCPRDTTGPGPLRSAQLLTRRRSPIGVASMAWGVVWVLYFRNRPDEHKKVTRVELAEMPDRPKSAVRPPVPWRRLTRAILPVAFVDFGYGWTLWVFLTWLPSFLGDSFGLKLLTYAGFTSVVLIGGVFGDTDREGRIGWVRPGREEL